MHKQVRDFLIQNGINCSYNEELDLILLNIPIGDDNFELIMKFPRYYPFYFPKIIIVDCKGIKIPHRYTDNSLCLYDPNEMFPDPNNYLEDALMIVNRAKELLIKSKSEDNILDYQWEVISYWESKSKGKVDYLGMDGDATRFVYVCELISGHYVVSDTINKINEFIGETYNLSIKNLEYEKALFVNTGKSLLLMIDTIKDIHDLIPEKDRLLFYEFLVGNKGDGIIIICADNGRGKCFLALKIELLSDNIDYSIENIEQILDINKEQEFLHLEVKNYQMQRLFTRGGDENACFDKDLLIIGCGSVGSYVSKAIVDTGMVRSMTLLDNDILSVDNLARHLCGSSYLLFDVYKVNALRQELLKHYPLLDCKIIEKNVWEYLLFKNSFFDSFDIVLVCVGNTVIEKKIIQMIKEKRINKECIILWVEPYLIAGHALILQNDINILTENNLFDCNGMFNNNVLENSNQYLKTEAGCQSAYAPYAGFEVQKFVQDVVDIYYRRFYKNKEKHNYELTWIGKMKWARQQHLDIKPMWRAKEDRYISLKRIDI